MANKLIESNEFDDVVLRVFDGFPSLGIIYEDGNKSYLECEGKRVLDRPVSGFRIYPVNELPTNGRGKLAQSGLELNSGFVVAVRYQKGESSVLVPVYNYKPEQIEEFQKQLRYGNLEMRGEAMNKLARLRTKDISDMLMNALKGGFRVRKRAWFLFGRGFDFHYRVLDQVNALDALASNYRSDEDVRDFLIKALTPEVQESRSRGRLVQRFSYPNCPGRLEGELRFSAKTSEKRGKTKTKSHWVNEDVWHDILPVYRKLGLTEQQDYQLIERYFEGRKQ